MSAQALRLRPPRFGDEAEVRAGHEELSVVGFPFLFRPELSWGEQLDLIDLQARGMGLAPGHVPSDYLVACVRGSDGTSQVVGRVSIRHSLTPVLRQIGGHVGYAVRPAFAGRGYATAMLRLALARMVALGVDDVLVTCSDDNIGSATVVERCGGVLEDRLHITDGVPLERRYWIDSRA